jgi:hypothetical protein
VVYDMKTGGFPKTSLPIGEQHVKLMIELSQIASNKYIGEYWVRFFLKMSVSPPFLFSSNETAATLDACGLCRSMPIP